MPNFLVPNALLVKYTVYMVYASMAYYHDYGLNYNVYLTTSFGYNSNMSNIRKHCTTPAVQPTITTFTYIGHIM